MRFILISTSQVPSSPKISPFREFLSIIKSDQIPAILYILLHFIFSIYIRNSLRKLEKSQAGLKFFRKVYYKKYAIYSLGIYLYNLQKSFRCSYETFNLFITGISTDNSSLSFSKGDDKISEELKVTFAKYLV